MLDHTEGPLHAFKLSDYWIVAEAPPKAGTHVCRLAGLPNAKANAMLFAAAPDLLKELEVLLDSVEKRMDPMDYNRDGVLAAIAKAKGQT